MCVTLLASKGRLAPLRQTTIPRLELCAAVESVKLDALVKRALDVELLPSTFWTDSEITRAYIRNDTKRFKVFVANRVSYIRQQSLPSQWLHVGSTENPADVLSRGTEIKCVTSIWFEGPSFLRMHRSEWLSSLKLDLLVHSTEVADKATHHTCGCFVRSLLVLLQAL